MTAKKNESTEATPAKPVAQKATKATPAKPVQKPSAKVEAASASKAAKSDVAADDKKHQPVKAAVVAKASPAAKSGAATGKATSNKLKLKVKVRPVPRARPTLAKARVAVPEPPPPPVLKTTLPLEFVLQQKQILLDLRDECINSMGGLAKDNLRGDGGNDTASAFGMHQADAGSDAYDRDFALSLLSQEQDALYEIEEALKRVAAGSYGVCEMSYKQIPVERLEAIPFARYTVDCQEQIEKERKMNGGNLRTTRPVFGVIEDGEENRETPVEED